MAHDLFFDECCPGSWQADIGQLSDDTKRKLQPLPVLRYGDLSPYRCFLLNENDGYFTVIMESGVLIRDVAAWFRPWKTRAEAKGGLCDADEPKPSCSYQSC